MIARTRCGWVMFRECGMLLCGKRLLLRRNGSVKKSYVWPAILYLSEVQCRKEYQIAILRTVDRSMVAAVCRVQLTDRRRDREFYVDVGFELNN